MRLVSINIYFPNICSLKILNWKLGTELYGFQRRFSTIYLVNHKIRLLVSKQGSCLIQQREFLSV